MRSSFTSKVDNFCLSYIKIIGKNSYLCKKVIRLCSFLPPWCDLLSDDELRIKKE